MTGSAGFTAASAAAGAAGRAVVWVSFASVMVDSEPNQNWRSLIRTAASVTSRMTSAITRRDSWLPDEIATREAAVRLWLNSIILFADLGSATSVADIVQHPALRNNGTGRGRRGTTGLLLS